jgi:DNA-binding CsgD family transcriptional regulator
VQNDAYLLRLSCYIHRNPLRAGAVDRLADYRWSSYLSYGYGRKGPEWLSTDLILSQFKGLDQQRRYREMVQKYAKEEKRLLEDLRHGLFWGSQHFVERIRKQHLPSKIDSSVPQQTQVAKPSDPVAILHSAQRSLKCDVESFVQTERVRGVDKQKRDLLIYLLWKTGGLSNAQIGDLFGVSHSAVSHAVRSIKNKMQHDGNIVAKFKQLNSQFKL